MGRDGRSRLCVLKMNDAEALMRNFATEIEADLAFRGMNIGDWHTGAMSDRQLLIYLEHLPDDSAFKKAFRNDTWTIDRYLSGAILNELRALRADLSMIFTGQRMNIDLMESPRQEGDNSALRNTSRKSHDDLMSELRGEKPE